MSRDCNDSVFRGAVGEFLEFAVSAPKVTMRARSFELEDLVSGAAVQLNELWAKGVAVLEFGHDLEDIVAVIDGRGELVSEIANASADVRAYIVSEIRGLMSDDDFREAIPGLLLPDPASQARRALLEERLNTIAALQ